MQEQQIFISYAHIDKSDALYVSSIIDNAIFTSVKNPGKSSLYDRLTLGTTLTLMSLFSSRKKATEIRDLQSTLFDEYLDIKLKAWMDEEIPAGANWHTEIQEAIKNCVGLILLVPSSVSSNVAIECGIAITLQKKIIPITRSTDDLYSYNLNQFQALRWPDYSKEWEAQLTTATKRIFD